MASKAAKLGSNPYNVFQVIFPGTAQHVTYTGTAGTSAAFGSGVTIAKLFPTTDCFVKFGTAPTATSSDHFLGAGIAEYFAVTAGEKVSVVQNASGGTLHISEGASS